MLLETQAIEKSYGAQAVLRQVSLQVAAGEIVCLLGPSGCGKSTLLRVIAGLEQDYNGSVIFNGRAIDHVPVHERGFGLMFQDFALFPHRSVGDNIAFGLRMQRLARAQIERRVDEMLDLVGLRGYAQRTIFELSGGERQRVALARSLAPSPRLLMLDEPLGALDRTLRERLTEELRQIIKAIGLTSVYVTHDQVEAFAVADRIMLMDRGEIVQSGRPIEVYRRPANVFAAKFLGLNNLLEARPLPSDAVQVAGVEMTEHTVLETAVGPLIVAGTAQVKERPIILVRPEAAEQPSSQTVNLVEGRVVRETFRGSTRRIALRHASGVELELDVPADSASSQEIMQVSLQPDRLTIINEQASEISHGAR